MALLIPKAAHEGRYWFPKVPWQGQQTVIKPTASGSERWRVDYSSDPTFSGHCCEKLEVPARGRGAYTAPARLAEGPFGIQYKPFSTLFGNQYLVIDCLRKLKSPSLDISKLWAIQCEFSINTLSSCPRAFRSAFSVHIWSSTLFDVNLQSIIWQCTLLDMIFRSIVWPCTLLTVSLWSMIWHPIWYGFCLMISAM